MKIKFHNPNAEIYIPDEVSLPEALTRTTHLGIGAHQDDLEIMAIHGILQCYGRPDRWFTGVTCTDGAGSPRAGVYAKCSDNAMKEVRQEEQRTAARVGQYAAIIQLGYRSKQVKAPDDPRLQQDLLAIFKTARPRVVYTHNPADKHNTHVAVMMAVVQALRELPPAQRPKKVYGCEVWRSLDWVPDNRKIVLDVSGRDHLAAALTGVYDSQIAGGKRYDLAMFGRFRANATYLESHAVDQAEAVAYALDLTPIIRNENMDAVEFVMSLIDEFRSSVREQFAALLGR